MDKSPPLLLATHWVEEYQGGQPACACGGVCLPALYSALHYCRITLAHLLAQGLNSNDTCILDSVLDRADEDPCGGRGATGVIAVELSYVKQRRMVSASHAKLKAGLTIHTR